MCLLGCTKRCAAIKRALEHMDKGACVYKLRNMALHELTLKRINSADVSGQLLSALRCGAEAHCGCPIPHPSARLIVTSASH